MDKAQRLAPPLAPVTQIVADVCSGKMSEPLACFLIEKHLEAARLQRGVTRRDQIAALVLPAIIPIIDRERRFEDIIAFESYCWERAYSLADAGEKLRLEEAKHG